MLPYIEDMRLDKIDVQFLEKWKTEINKKDISLGRKKGIHKCFNTFLNYCEKVGYMQSNPLRIVGNFVDPNALLNSEEKIKYWTAAQFKLFIAEAEKQALKTDLIVDWDYYIFFLIAYLTGLRKGEIHALKWKEIDFENSTLRVRESLNQRLQGDDIITAPKTKSSYRTISLTPKLIEELKKHYDRYATCKSIEGLHVCGGEKTIRDSTIAHRKLKYSNAAGLAPISVHEFRHSHASLLINEGINIYEIARRLGHSDIKMTLNTYGHLYPREEEKAIKVLTNCGF